MTLARLWLEDHRAAAQIAVHQGRTAQMIFFKCGSQAQQMACRAGYLSVGKMQMQFREQAFQIGGPAGLVLPVLRPQEAVDLIAFRQQKFAR